VRRRRRTRRPVAIETNGYLLRSLRPADANPRFLEWLNDEEMMRGLNLPSLRFTLGQLRAFIAGFENLRNWHHDTLTDCTAHAPGRLGCRPPPAGRGRRGR
jgi:hypothetical protein